MTTHVFWGKGGRWSNHGTSQRDLETTRAHYEAIFSEQLLPGTPDHQVPDALLLVELREPPAPPRAVTYRLERVGVRLVPDISEGEE